MMTIMRFLLVFTLYVLNLTHKSEPVAAPYHSYFFVGIMATKEVTGEVEHLGAVGESWYSSVAVEVGAESYVFYSHDVYCVLEVLQCVQDCCLAILTQEARIEGDMCYSPFACECSHLVVGEVALMVAEGTKLLWLHTMGVLLISSAS